MEGVVRSRITLKTGLVPTVLVVVIIMPVPANAGQNVKQGRS